jgi:predicted metal-dependent phosphoesterase TrpH
MVHKIELHCHTSISNDSLTSFSIFESFLRRNPETIIAITDHNSIKAAEFFKKMFPERIIVGEEIEVTSRGKFVGEIIGYFLQEEVPGGKDVEWVVGQLKRQKAYISIPHPCDTMRTRWTTHLLKEIMPHVDGIEVFNSRCWKPVHNRRAMDLARQFGKDQLVGSDAHSVGEIGKSYHLWDDFECDHINLPETFRKVIGKAQHVTVRSPFWVHALSRYAVLRHHSSNP